MTDRVRDKRGLYLQPGEKVDAVVAEQGYLARPFVNSNGQFPVTTGVGQFGGVLISARGAAGVTVDVYDASQASEVVDDNILGPAETSTYDGFVNFPVSFTRGLRVVIANATALTRVVVYFRQ